MLQVQVFKLAVAITLSVRRSILQTLKVMGLKFIMIDLKQVGFGMTIK
ncbi:Uncharacterised protein [Mycobacteroides abscessus subsp. abscessus]|nr:Uncharacterised protein [Mycobacteroides abscessus]SIN56424.1 Uncharacterised protein [Mycobacteroides abscessus subsp. abscessus]